MLTTDLPSSTWLALFPGQGSQRVGMGRRIVEQYAAASEVFDRASAALDMDLRELCWNSSLQELTATENAQPALTAVGLAAFAAFVERRKPNPGTGYAGHSVGALAAASAAGCIDLETAVILARARGKLMSAAPGVGSMLAIAVDRAEGIEELARLGAALAAEHGLDLAAINGPRQVVLSGPKSAVQQAAVIHGAKSRELLVSHAFHSRMMAPGQQQWDSLLNQTTFRPANGHYLKVTDGRKVSDGHSVREDLRANLCGPVMWAKVMTNSAEFNEMVIFGPGSAIRSLARPYLGGRVVVAVETAVPA